MINKIVFVCLLCVFFGFSGFAVGNPDGFIQKVSSRLLMKLTMSPQEKVYLHTDRAHYVAGERIWFRAYLQNAITHVPSQKSKFVYVELTDRSDSVLLRVKVIRRDSVFCGFLGIPPSISSGDYVLRAYSYWMQNLGDGYLFKKNIRIVNGTGRPAPQRDHRVDAEPAGGGAGKIPDPDVQFFPEGGHLLSGNYQAVGFKAVGSDGAGVDIFGDICNDAGEKVTAFAGTHAGMGMVKVPVLSGRSYHALVKTAGGIEKKVPLPPVEEEAIGLKVVQTDSLLKYSIIKGAGAVLPPNLYVVIHSRGFLYTVAPVDRFFTGIMNISDMLDGIAHVVLLDDQCRIYSQRVCFIRRSDRPQLAASTDKPFYSHREPVKLNLKFAENVRSRLDGSFSVAVTDDGKVYQDSTVDTILSGLLLTSDLKGYIENPAWYFEQDDQFRRKSLDHLMLTQGWTKFDLVKEIKGEYDSLAYELEVGQTISGTVKNLWGKNLKSVQVILLSTANHFILTETDSAGHFLAQGILFPDSTDFIVQGSNRRGRNRVSVVIDREQFEPVSNIFIDSERKKKDDDAFYNRFQREYYYEDGIKVHVLEEVQIRSFHRPKSYSFYDDLADYRFDSARIAEMKNKSIEQILEEIPNVTVEQNQILRWGRDTLLVFINDFQVELDQVRQLQPEYVRSITFLGHNKGRSLFGEEGKSGVLVISVDRRHYLGAPNLSTVDVFHPFGYQKPSAFYEPRYDIDSVRLRRELDERSTIYWNPIVNIGKETSAEISFYTADVSGKYTVIIEGVTGGGEICRKVMKVDVK